MTQEEAEKAARAYQLALATFDVEIKRFEALPDLGDFDKVDICAQHVRNAADTVARCARTLTGTRRR